MIQIRRCTSRSFGFCHLLLLLVITATAVLATSSSPTGSPEIMLGIDYGFDNAVMSVYHEGRIQIIPNAQMSYQGSDLVTTNSTLTPTAIAFTSNDTILIGQPAVDYMRINPRNVVHSLRHLLSATTYDNRHLKWMKQRGAEFRFTNQSTDNFKPMIEITRGNGTFTSYSVEDVTTIFLTHLKSQAESYFNGRVNVTGSYFTMVDGGERMVLYPTLQRAGMPIKKWCREYNMPLLAYESSALVCHPESHIKHHNTKYNTRTLLYHVESSGIRLMLIHDCAHWPDFDSGISICDMNIAKTLTRKLTEEALQLHEGKAMQIDANQRNQLDRRISTEVMDVFFKKPNIDCIQLPVHHIRQSISFLTAFQCLNQERNEAATAAADGAHVLKFTRDSFSNHLYSILKLSTLNTHERYFWRDLKHDIVTNVIMSGDSRYTSHAIRVIHELLDSKPTPAIAALYPPRIHADIKPDEVLARGIAMMMVPWPQQHTDEPTFWLPERELQILKKR